MINTIIRTYEILDNEKVNRIDCEMGYRRGGANMWHMTTDARGYYFSISEYKLVDHGNGLYSQEFTISVLGTHGIKCLVVPVSRQSKKQYEIAKGKLDECIERFLAPYCAENGLTLGEMVEETEKER